MCIQRDRFNRARSSVASDLLKSSSVLTFNLRSNCLARSVIRAKRFDKTPRVAAIPVIKNTGATAVCITLAIVKMLITSLFIKYLVIMQFLFTNVHKSEMYFCLYISVVWCFFVCVLCMLYAYL